MDGNEDEPSLKKTKVQNLPKEDEEVMYTRTKRIVKVKQFFPCPVCGEELTSEELSPHLNNEVCWLQDYTKKLFKRHSYSSSRRTASESDGRITPSTSTSTEEMTHKEMREALLQVRQNRRQRVRGAARCPVCFKAIPGEEREVQEHVDSCLERSTRRNEEENGPIIVDESSDDDEEFDSYTWCGQTRVRATSGMHSHAFGSLATRGKKVTEDEDALVNVEEVEENQYGDTQYDEKDVILPSRSNNAEVREALAIRSALVGQSQVEIPESRKRWEDAEIDTDELGNESTGKENIIRDCCKVIQDKYDLSIKKLESLQGNLQKCLICMEPYQIPVISTTCWHVFCEECWLRSLGSKKVCPKCNEITSPSNLRKIYL